MAAQGPDRYRRAYLLLRRAMGLLAALIATGCGDVPHEAEPAQTPVAAPAQTAPVVFTEVAKNVGIDFIHNTGAFGRK